MQKYNATVISTTGAPGTGKTYSRCARFLYDWWLPEEKGVHWSNFPVNVEAFAKKFPDASERIRIIPPEELKKWAACDGISGPWDFFHGVDLQGAHIAIDECHNYLSRTGKGAQVNAKRWQTWLGEIRHRGCTVEFLSQDPHKVHPVVEQHSAVRIQLVNSEDRRDPFFGVLLGDWYEVRALVSGDYETLIWQLEERRINGRWVEAGFTRFTIDPQYFPLYDSFNTPQSGGGKAEGQLREFQKRGRFGLLWWFGKRNWHRFLSRGLLAAGVVWLCFFGGLTHVFDRFHKSVRTSVDEKKKSEDLAISEPEKQPGTVSVTPTAEKKQPAKAPLFTAESEEPKKPTPATVRSETLQHRSIEAMPSAEAQQKALPRLVLMSRDHIAMDDGLMVSVGEKVGTYELKTIDYSRRVAIFKGDDDGSLLRVPVGGPVGVRVSTKTGEKRGGILGSFSDILPSR